MIRKFEFSDDSQRECLEQELISIGRRALFDTSTEDTVRNIIKTVVEKGDKALVEYTKRFDGVSISSENIKVKESEFKNLENIIEQDFKEAFAKAKENIRDYHSKQKVRNDWILDAKNELFWYGESFTPISSIGAYVPGGSAPLISTLLMICIPAKIAGVEKIRVATPPSSDGKLNPYILYACKVLEVDEIYKIGGAQAIAALAFGTESVRKVDKICGPGNKYVTEAKRQVFGYTGIDMLAGPSEVCILADRSANPEFIAADILSQAEHDPESRAVLLTDSKKISNKVCECLEEKLMSDKRRSILEKSLEKSFIILTDNIDQAYELVQEIAPEHLEVMVSKLEKVKKRTFNAGAVFFGDYTPVVTGDVFAGPNHVLPTEQRARFQSPLGVYDFIRRNSKLYYSKEKLFENKDIIMKLAEIEQLPWHKHSVEVRFKKELKAEGERDE
ncbi:MAG: histidinol dehydrogenase [Candidatus Aureabacteria bacterium]|nr:histidinol dehydrogenase [Candidatus Auribacterota bacterium]